MRVKKKYIMRALMKSAKTALVAFSILGATLLLISCSDPSQRHYQMDSGTPPHMENDMGRPEEYKGKIFSRGFKVF